MGPGEPFQMNVHLVAQPVGVADIQECIDEKEHMLD
jgi:hypothetical protein